MPVGVSQIPVKAFKAQDGLTRPTEGSNLGIRHPTHLGNNLVAGTPLSSHRVTKGSTGMMMVTQPCKGPGTQDSSAWFPKEHSKLG